MEWVAFPLHPETPPEGKTLEELFADRMVDIPAMMSKLKAVAKSEGLPFGDRKMTFNSRLAQELGKWVEKQGSGSDYHVAVFRSYFESGKNIARKEVLLHIVNQLGLPLTHAEKIIENRTCKQSVDRDWAFSREMGITAVPTFMIGNRTLVGAHPYSTMKKFVEECGILPRS